MTHSSGWSSAASDSSVSAASPTRNRSGGGPASRPNAIFMASRCGAGSAGSSAMNGTSSWCRAANSRLISDSTPMTLETRRSGAESMAYSSSVVLPVPCPPRSTSVPLKPSRTESSTRSMAARSRWRSSMPGPRCGPPPACRRTAATQSAGQAGLPPGRPHRRQPSSPAPLPESSRTRPESPAPYRTSVARPPGYMTGALA